MTFQKTKSSGFLEQHETSAASNSFCRPPQLSSDLLHEFAFSWGKHGCIAPDGNCYFESSSECFKCKLFSRDRVSRTDVTSILFKFPQALFVQFLIFNNSLSEGLLMEMKNTLSSESIYNLKTNLLLHICRDQDATSCETEERWEVFKRAVCQLRQLV